jgi:hypothetical protein
MSCFRPVVVESDLNRDGTDVVIVSNESVVPVVGDPPTTPSPFPTRAFERVVLFSDRWSDDIESDLDGALCCLVATRL